MLKIFVMTRHGIAKYIKKYQPKYKKIDRSSLKIIFTTHILSDKLHYFFGKFSQKQKKLDYFSKFDYFRVQGYHPR